jgi:transposase
MADAYAVELRERVVRAYESGEGTQVEISERFALGEATVKRWVWLKRRTGAVSPAPKGGGTRSEIGAADIETMLDRLGDATAVELTAEYNRTRRGSARGVRVIYQPPHSPDFNPIEPAWALQKQHVRKHAPRAHDALRRVARRARFRVTPRHCQQWFAHAGYGDPLR